MKPILLAVVLVMLAFVAQARACSIIPRDDFLSNYEMVKKADAIVLARSIIPLPFKDDEERFFPLLRFQILRIVKGKYPEKTLVTRVGSTDEEHYRGRSDAEDFSRARPGTYSGGCTANDFHLNANYLLFLTQKPVQAATLRDDDENVETPGWDLGIQILSRDREEVTGEDDPWMQAVKRYVEVAALSEYAKEKEGLIHLRRNAAEGKDKEHIPLALAADIDRHFAAASAMKSYADLKAMYDVAPDDRRRDAAVYAMAAAKHPQAFDLIYQRFGGATIEYFGAVSNLRSAAILAEQFHKEKALAAQGGYSGRSREIAELLARVATRDNTPLMMEALRAADPKDYESDVLSGWFVQHPSSGGTALVRELVGKEYSGKWPLTESLALLGDEGVVRWAKEAAFTPDYIRPVYAIGYSPLPEADAVAQKIIASGDNKRIDILFYSYRDKEGLSNSHREQRLQQIIEWRKAHNKNP